MIRPADITQDEMTENEIYTFPIVTQPINLKINLYRHQLTSIYHMEKIEKEREIKLNDYGDIIKTNYAIQGDMTGYGKTLSMIGLIMRNKMKWPINKPYLVKYKLDIIGAGNLYIKRTRSYKRISTTLVVVNQSLLGQWLRELKNSTLKIGIISNNKELENINVEKVDVVLCLHTFYNNLAIKTRYLAWKRFIFDEPSMIKISNMQYIICGFYWFVTATPYFIWVNQKFMKGDFMKNFFPKNMTLDIDKIIIRNNIRYLKSSFKMPTTKYVFYTCFNPLKGLLNGIVKESILNLISAGDIDGAIKRYGGGSTSNLIELVKNKKLEQIRGYEIIINSENTLEETKLKNIEKKTRLENQIKELNIRFEKYMENPCNICYDDLQNPVMLTCCQNIFCAECVLKWLANKNNCPMCRSTVVPEYVIRIKKEGEETCKKRELKTKPETVVEIIKNKKDGKFIIFSSYNETFNIITKFLNENDIKFKEIKGNTLTRTKNIKEYKEGNSNVIFLNSKNNGSGINLQETTDVILYHKLDNSTLTQILGRANRIGRTEELIVHNLLEE